jgi:hypothetical protein
MSRAEQRLEEGLVGTWRLRRLVLRDRAGSERFPLGAQAEGRLLYTAEGLVSVHGMAAGRPDCGADRVAECTPEEKIAVAETYFGYTGSWECRGDSVVHRVAVSSFPNWTGRDLVRQAELDGDRLVLRHGPVGENAAEVVLSWIRESPQGG